MADLADAISDASTNLIDEAQLHVFLVPQTQTDDVTLSLIGCRLGICPRRGTSYDTYDN